MHQIISFPHLGDYHVAFKYLFVNLTDIKVMEAPFITKRTIELGSKHSPSDVCVPFKYNLGNYIEALEKGANILFQAGGGCRYRYYGEVQEKILRDLGYNFEFIKLTSKHKIYLREVYSVFKRFNKKLNYFKFLKCGLTVICMIEFMDRIDTYIRANIGSEVKKNSFVTLKKKMLRDFSKVTGVFSLYKCYLKYKKLFKEIKVNKKDTIKIGIIGELYTQMESFSNYNLEKKLASYNVEIKRFTNLSYLLWKKGLSIKKILKKSKDYCKYTLGADGLDNVYRAIYLSEHNYDGVIHVKPFGCTPEIGAIPIIKKVCADKKMPIIFFSLDSEFEDEGMNTRIEAFYDLLKFRKEKK